MNARLINAATLAVCVLLCTAAHAQRVIAQVRVQSDAPVKAAVRSCLQAVASADVDGLTRSAHLPFLIVRSSADGASAQTAVLTSNDTATSLKRLPPIEGADALGADIAANMTVNFLGETVAVGVVHPRPSTQAPGATGCAALVGRTEDNAWKVVCLVIGPSSGPLADVVQQTIQRTVGSFWQALLGHDIALVRSIVNLPYADVAANKPGADIQIVTDQLLRQLQAQSKPNDSSEELAADPTSLVTGLQLRYFGQAAAVGLYTSSFSDFADQPQECAIVVRGADGRWRIVAVGSK